MELFTLWTADASESVVFTANQLNHRLGMQFLEGKAYSCLAFQSRADILASAKGVYHIGDADSDTIREEIGGARNLPEQLFGSNLLEITHKASGLRIQFSALGALRQWHSANIPPLQLKGARDWKQARAASFETNEIEEVTYDW